MLWWTLHRLKSSDVRTRESAAFKLGNSKDKKAVPALIAALHDESASVRKAVARALAMIPHPASAEPLASHLESMGSPGSGRRAPSGTAVDTEEYKAVAEAIGAQGKPAQQPLLRILRSEGREARRWAAYALGLIGEPGATDALIRSLDDNRSDVRQEAALALGRIGDPRGTDALARALSHKDPETRRTAAEALGGIGGDEAIEALGIAAAGREEAIQLAAIAALCRIGSVRAALRLRSALEAPKKAVRESAAAGLKAMSLAPANSCERAALSLLTGDFEAALREGDAAVQPLVEALGSKDPERRRRAAEGLTALRAERAIQPLLRALKDLDGTVRTAAAEALAAIGAPAADGLREAASSPDVSVQRQAAQALGRIADAQSAGILTEIIKGNRRASTDYSEPLEAAQAAADALGMILRQRAASISSGDLKLITELPDPVLEHPAEDGGLPTRVEVRVGCSVLRDLAQRELRRRQP